LPGSSRSALATLRKAAMHRVGTNSAQFFTGHSSSATAPKIACDWFGAIDLTNEEEL